MDKNLVCLERAQEEFHQVFDNRMEDMEDKMQVAKTDIDVLRIRMSSSEGEVTVLTGGEGTWILVGTC